MSHPRSKERPLRICAGVPRSIRSANRESEARGRSRAPATPENNTMPAARILFPRGSVDIEEATRALLLAGSTGHGPRRGALDGAMFDGLDGLDGFSLRAPSQAVQNRGDTPWWNPKGDGGVGGQHQLPVRVSKAYTIRNNGYRGKSSVGRGGVKLFSQWSEHYHTHQLISKRMPADSAAP
eukprot:6020406-Pyramimonas_sp.AAC.1